MPKFDTLKINLSYGQGYLPIDLPGDRTSVIESAQRTELTYEKAAVINALKNPIADRPLREWVKPGDRFSLKTGLGHCKRGMTDFGSHSMPRAWRIDNSACKLTVMQSFSGCLRILW